MPNIKSAAKRVETIRTKTLRNVRIKSALRTAIRKLEGAMSAANLEEADQKLRTAVQALDKAVTKGILHKNAAARKKSRLTKKLNNLKG
ncbi:30S ribosomal protein S20 [Pelotomaculum sp. PtaB.Bin117]|uniref:30S ribosomal protein S20 n=1 Tax=Pelotomaculum sp. PtaB.Bin117 TaxID=1811694 RepID=UPI0009D2BA90|nr:30S ribosomal protein S20 [Pelotomaculum sp. PtaB.Bin117]OPX87052.1 MAG: 30S ribosomal protein S20 [Pelotomaculum sp. PtaB.Bin117]